VIETLTAMPEATPTTAARLGALDTPASRLCVGIDPHAQTLRDWGLGDTPEGIGEFGTRLIDACVAAGIAVIKPQVALYERHGVAGMRALAVHIATARQAGLVVIADAKRGDIGSSLEGYADAWLGPGQDWESDAVTLNPFLGVDALEAAFEVALDHGKAVFVLTATSNPESETLQSARTASGDSLSRRSFAVSRIDSNEAGRLTTGWGRSWGQPSTWGAEVSNWMRQPTFHCSHRVLAIKEPSSPISLSILDQRPIV